MRAKTVQPFAVILAVLALASSVGAECSTGYYFKDNACHACDTGKYQPNNFYTDSLCFDCERGTYQVQRGRPDCIDCFPGYYAPTEGQTQCSACPAGKYQNEDKATSCKDCDIGFYRPNAGQTSCAPCPAGWYGDQKALTACKRCDPGTYNDEAQQATCKQCTPGTYQSQSGRTSCVDCPEGYFQDRDGRSGCKACPKGQYQNLRQETSCKECWLGSFQDQLGQRTCKGCPGGTYNDERGESTCKTCEPGKFNNVGSASSCKNCTVGLFAPTPGRTGCSGCPGGKYADVEGLAQCKDCPIGKYQNQGARPSCEDCPPGYYADVEGHVNCKRRIDCPVGTYISTWNTPTSDRICSDCPIGKYQNQGNRPECLEPPAGYYQDQEGQWTYKRYTVNCPAGTEVFITRSTSSDRVCQTCQQGKFSTTSNQEDCFPGTICQPGYRETTGITTTSDRKCEICLEGKYSSSQNSLVCEDCNGVDFFQDLRGQPRCKNATICLPGNFVSQQTTTTSDRQCSPCDFPNEYQDQPNQLSCKPISTCKVGEYEAAAPTAAANRDCVQCDGKDFYQDEAEQKQCKPTTKCPPGYGTLIDSTPFNDRLCTACDPGNTFSDQNSGEYCKPVTDCPAGFEESAPPTASSNRVCRPCLGDTFKPEPGQLTSCRPATQCGPYEAEVKIRTPSSDRICNPVRRCIEGIYEDTGEPCTCPGGESCQSCVFDTNAVGYSMVQIDAVPAGEAVDSNHPCDDIQAGQNVDVAALCNQLCGFSPECVGFFVFTSGPARGRCCPKRRMNLAKMSPLLNGASYQVDQCRKCDNGFFKKGLTCEPESVKPFYDPRPPESLTVAQHVPVGTELLDLSAKSLTGYNPITWTMSVEGLPEGVLSIDAESGKITLAEPLTTAGDVLITVVATDTQETCTVIDILGQPVSTPGGCKTPAQITLNVGTFVGCQSDTIFYLGPLTPSMTLAPAKPTLVGLPGVLVSEQGADEAEFTVGTYVVSFETPDLDVGGKLVCEYQIKVFRGVTLSISSISHFTSSNFIRDYIVSTEQIGDIAVLKPPSFTADILADIFALGLLPPSAKPFTLSIVEGYVGRIHVRLQWCTQGSTYNPNSLTPSSVTVSLKTSDGRLVSFTNQDSGRKASGTCFVVSAVSEPITGVASFDRFDVEFDANEPAARRRRRSPMAYQPVSPSAVYVEYTPTNAINTTGSEDPGQMLSLEDVIPPQWAGCPIQPLVVQAPPGQSSVVVMWDEPSITDNVGVDQADITQTHYPGDSFDVLNSPYTVHYQATDGAGLSAECEFQIVIDAPDYPLQLAAFVDESFPLSQTELGLLELTAFSQSVLDPMIPGLSFSADLGNYTSVRLLLDVLNQDRVVVRTHPDAIQGKAVVNLQWQAANANPVGLPDASDVRVYIILKNYQEDLNGPVVAEFEIELDSAYAVVDPDEGVVVVSGQTPPYLKEFSFTGVEVLVTYPLGRSLSTAKTYNLSADSSISFRLNYPSSTVANVPSDSYGDILTLLDSEPPTFQVCPDDILVPNVVGANGSYVSWDEPVVTDDRVDFTLEVNATNGAWFAIQPRSAGPAIVTYTARDTFGNEATCSFRVNVLDAEPPILECAEDVYVQVLPGQGNATIPPFKWQPPALDDNSPYDPSVLQPELKSLLILPVGEHRLEIIAADDAGNENICFTNITVYDPENPVINCPQPNPVNAENKDGAVVTWNEPAASDNDMVAMVNSSHSSNTTFPSGRTTVTYIVYDRSGNSASCDFVVEVVSPESSNQQASTSVIGGAAAGAVLLLGVIAALFAMIVRAKRKAKQPANWNEIFGLIEQFKDASSKGEGPIVPRELPRASIELLEELGKGAFGQVYKGLFRETPATPAFLVAVKSLQANSTNSDRKELLEEAAISAQFRHANIVQLIGVVTIGKPVLVVLEFCENGSLKSFLEKNDIDEETKVRFAFNCAAGLEHVHARGFIHRDVAARNVLLDSEMVAKIADFGLARDTQDNNYYRSKSGQIPVRWSAPEALDNRVFDTRTDVWSFGVLLYEIWTKADMPYKGWHNQKVWVQVSGGYRMPQPPECTTDVYMQMLKCWDADPNKRPNLIQLLDFFKALYHSHTGQDVDGYLALGEEEEDDLEEKSRNQRVSIKRVFSSIFRGSKNKKARDATVNPVYDTSDSHTRSSSDPFDRPLVVNPLFEGLNEKDELDITELAALDEEEDIQPKKVQRSSVKVYSLPSKKPSTSSLGSTTSSALPPPSEPDQPDLYGNVETNMSAIPKRKVSADDVGKRVRVQGYKCLGYLRFFGVHHSKGTPRCGVELDDAVGKNNGTVAGHTYFSCEENRGVLCIPDKVTVLE